MYSIDQISNAAAQLTGEHLEGARLRLSALACFDQLIPAASAGQALLESMLTSVLGTVDGQSRPLGIREAKPVNGGLVLRVERAEDVQALFTLLPYRTKRGPWREARGLVVRTEGARLRFGLRGWLSERPWHSAGATVWVAGPQSEDLAALLADHEEQIRAAGHIPQWDPQCSDPGPKRKEPAARSFVRQLSASCAMGSALLRRPRLWDSLAGYAGVQVGTRMTDYGLDWIVERQVAGPQFDDDRLIRVLTDHVVGCGLRLLDHACGTEECTIRLVPQPGVWGWRGVLTIHSRKDAARPRNQVPDPRPLTAIGDRLRPSRPQSNASYPEQRIRDHGGAVIHLFGVPHAGYVQREELAWIAEQIAAVWTAQGLATAIVFTHGQDDWLMSGDRGQPTWATASVPKAAAGWRRLRIAPPPGELWSLKITRDWSPPGSRNLSLQAKRYDSAIEAALAHARRTFDRVFLIGRNHGVPWEDESLGPRADMHVLVHQAERYERHIPLSTEAGQDHVMLTPAESAVQWRQQELGRWTPTRPLTGMLLLNADDHDATPDEFDLAVENQLARYGTPVLGRYPANWMIVQGAGHRLHPPTVLDPQTDQPTHVQMTKAADALARHLWPDAPAAAERVKAPDT